MKGGIGWKLITLALEGDPWNVYLKFLSREIDIKLCQFYTKIHIYTISCRNSRFKQLIFSIYATNLKSKISLWKLIFTFISSNNNSITFIFIFRFPSNFQEKSKNYAKRRSTRGIFFVVRTCAVEPWWYTNIQNKIWKYRCRLGCIFFPGGGRIPRNILNIFLLDLASILKYLCTLDWLIGCRSSLLWKSTKCYDPKLNQLYLLK